MTDALTFIVEHLLAPIIGPDIGVIGGILLILIFLVVMVYFQLPFEALAVVMIPLVWVSAVEGLLPLWMIAVLGLACAGLIFMAIMKLLNR